MASYDNNNNNGTLPQTHTLPKYKVIEDRSKFLAKAQYTFYQKPIMLVRGAGQYAWDESERRYLDCYANVAHVGYAHPHVTKAATEQLMCINSNTRYLHDKIVRLADKLTSKMPKDSGLEVCFFVNSGSEANDLAIRLARVYTARNSIIALENSYHGTTGTCTGVSSSISTGKSEKCPDWDYYARDVEYVRVPDMLRGPYGKGEHAVSEYLKDIDSAYEKRSVGDNNSGHDIAAFIHESMQGVGGQFVFPEGYLSQVYNKVKGNGGICIADEVQTGFGRIGSHYWAFEHDGIVPDIVTMGKPFGNGQPLGCVVTTRKIAEAFNNSQYFNTFGGNPVSCAIGLSVIEVIDQENLQQNSLEVGTYLKNGLTNLMKHHKLIGEVRGKGLFLGVELVKDAHSGNFEPAQDETKLVWERTKELGVLIGSGGPLRNVLRIKGPVCLTKEDAQFFIDCLDHALTEVEAGKTLSFGKTVPELKSTKSATNNNSSSPSSILPSIAAFSVPVVVALLSQVLKP